MIFKAIDFIYKLGDGLNFIMFIAGSKYPTLVHRFAKINFVRVV